MIIVMRYIDRTLPGAVRIVGVTSDITISESTFSSNSASNFGGKF